MGVRVSVRGFMGVSVRALGIPKSMKIRARGRGAPLPRIHVFGDRISDVEQFGPTTTTPPPPEFPEMDGAGGVFLGGRNPCFSEPTGPHIHISIPGGQKWIRGRAEIYYFRPNRGCGAVRGVGRGVDSGAM